MSVDSIPELDLLTIPEVADLLKVSIPTVRRLQGQHLIPFIKVGGSVRFIRGDVVAYVQQERVESIGK